MSMRVTQAGFDSTMIGELDSSLSRLQNLQQQAATGRAINQPSDNPGGTATALALNAQIGRFQQYSANAADAGGWLGSVDTALASVGTGLDQVQTDLLSGANASASDATSRAALATDVQAIKQSLIGTANSTYLNRPLFSGTWDTSAYAGAAGGDYTYTGSPQAISRTVAPNQKLQVSVTGQAVFGDGSTSLFALLDQISADLGSGNSSALSGTDLTQLKAAMASVTAVHGQVGDYEAQAASLKTQADNKVQALQGSVAGVVDADEASVIAELQLQESSFQAALSTTAKVIQPTLANFLQ